MAKHRTTLLLDPDLVQAAQKALRTTTVTETVERSLQAALNQSRREALRKRLGAFDLDLDLKELRRLRK
jgi:Arc/MetJ family transcription regulator